MPLDEAVSRPVTYRILGRPGADDRPALPAGHPVTWGAITDGTLLDGAKYSPPASRVGTKDDP